MVELEGGIIVYDTLTSDQLEIRSDERMVERLALVGFLAGYSGPTRDSYRTDLRIFTVWLSDRQVRLSTSSARTSSCTAAGYASRSRNESSPAPPSR